ncbi:MAG: TIGR01212 family radical SAM protein [candidate division WOR-3 bacterium]
MITVGKYWKEKFGEKVYRVCIDGGFTCPTRDGTKGIGGCYFCDEESSRAKYIEPEDSIERQLEKGILRLKEKGVKKFIAYFQSYTNTYAKVDVLREKYFKALNHPEVVGISISTRPDCIDEEIVKLLDEISKRYYTIVELGIQSMHDKTLEFIGRKHTSMDSIRALKLLKRCENLEIVAHVILGLPGETKEDMMETGRILSKLGIDGLKLHHLYIVKGTPFFEEFKKGNIKVFERPEDYAKVAKDFLSNFSKDIVIHRFAGYSSSFRLVAPSWTSERSIAKKLIIGN